MSVLLLSVAMVAFFLALIWWVVIPVASSPRLPFWLGAAVMFGACVGFVGFAWWLDGALA